jgi:ATP synthase protein I
MQTSDPLRVKRVLSIQLVMTLALAAVAFLVSKPAALSVLIGAGACTAANGLFALLVFTQYRAHEPGLLVMRFYAAEIVKIALILAVFAAAFVLFEGLILPALLGAYLVAQVLPPLLVSEAGAAKIQEK